VEGVSGDSSESSASTSESVVSARGSLPRAGDSLAHSAPAMLCSVQAYIAVARHECLKADDSQRTNTRQRMMHLVMFGSEGLTDQPGRWGRRYFHRSVVQTRRSDDAPENKQQSVQSE
jgi:hypothetical protein